MKPVLRAAEELNPELRGKLRIVAVVLDIREMTKREEADFRKFQAKD